MSIVCCLSIVVCGSLFGVCCWLFVDWCSLFGVCRLMTDVRCLLQCVRCLLLRFIGRPLLVVCCLLSVGCGLLCFGVLCWLFVAVYVLLVVLFFC